MDPRSLQEINFFTLPLPHNFPYPITQFFFFRCNVGFLPTWIDTTWLNCSQLDQSHDYSSDDKSILKIFRKDGLYIHTYYT